jgi:hypothetical protein
MYPHGQRFLVPSQGWGPPEISLGRVNDSWQHATNLLTLNLFTSTNLRIPKDYDVSGGKAKLPSEEGLLKT